MPLHIIVFLVFISCHLTKHVEAFPKRSSDSVSCIEGEEHHRNYGRHASMANVTHPFSVVKPLNVDFITSTEIERDAKAICVFPAEVASDASLNDRTLCPWVWKVNYNANRLPKALLEAECKCDKIKETLSEGGGSMAHRYVECEHVYFDVKVLRFDSACMEFREDTEQLALACVPINNNANPMVHGSIRDSNAPIDY